MQCHTLNAVSLHLHTYTICICTWRKYTTGHALYIGLQPTCISSHQHRVDVEATEDGREVDQILRTHLRIRLLFGVQEPLDILVQFKVTVTLGLYMCIAQEA